MILLKKIKMYYEWLHEFGLLILYVETTLSLKKKNEKKLLCID